MSTLKVSLGGLKNRGHFLEAYRHDAIGKKLKLEVVSQFDDADLAVLRFKNDDYENYPALVLADEDEAKGGQEVLLAGFPEYAPGATPSISKRDCLILPATWHF